MTCDVHLSEQVLEGLLFDLANFGDGSNSADASAAFSSVTIIDAIAFSMGIQSRDAQTGM